MSRENVETTARLFELYDRGEVEAMLAEIDPDFELDLTERIPDQDLIRGHDAYRDFLENGLSMWSEFRVEIEDLIDAGDDKVVAYVRTQAVGVGSGVPVSEKVAYVGWFRDGVAYRMKIYPDRADALAAAGVSD
jgi:ketosteroid isomerase-like protein